MPLRVLPTLKQQQQQAQQQKPKLFHELGELSDDFATYSKADVSKHHELSDFTVSTSSRLYYDYSPMCKQMGKGMY